MSLCQNWIMTLKGRVKDTSSVTHPELDSELDPVQSLSSCQQHGLNQEREAEGVLFSQGHPNVLKCTAWTHTHP